jgi:hypothetical protein
VSMRPPGSQPILNYATTPRYDDLPIPGDPLRTARKGAEAVFGYAAYDRYKTTNSVAAPRTSSPILQPDISPTCKCQSRVSCFARALTNLCFALLCSDDVVNRTGPVLAYLRADDERVV